MQFQNGQGNALCDYLHSDEVQPVDVPLNPFEPDPPPTSNEDSSVSSSSDDSPYGSYSPDKEDPAGDAFGTSSGSNSPSYSTSLGSSALDGSSSQFQPESISSGQAQSRYPPRLFISSGFRAYLYIYNFIRLLSESVVNSSRIHCRVQTEMMSLL